MNNATIDLNLAKNVFPIHGADARGKTVQCKQLSRQQLIPFPDQVAT